MQKCASNSIGILIRRRRKPQLNGELWIKCEVKIKTGLVQWKCRVLAWIQVSTVQCCTVQRSAVQCSKGPYSIGDSARLRSCAQAELTNLQVVVDKSRLQLQKRLSSWFEPHLAVLCTPLGLVSEHTLSNCSWCICDRV